MLLPRCDACKQLYLYRCRRLFAEIIIQTFHSFDHQILATADMRISTVWFMGWSALSLAFPLSTRNDTDAHKNTDAQSRRLATYVQSFNTLAGGNMSLLPIRDQQTHVTHAILAAIHVEDTPGVIHLNDNDIDSSYWDVIWAEAALLQSAGTKVMMMLGGAAPGSYQRLCSGDGAGSVLVSMHYQQDNATILTRFRMRHTTCRCKRPSNFTKLMDSIWTSRKWFLWLAHWHCYSDFMPTSVGSSS
jgi:hypothetical protein